MIRMLIPLAIIGCMAIAFLMNSSNAATDRGSVLIRDVPHVMQKPDFCGEACVASWLQKLGLPADQDAVFDQSGLDPELARGCYTAELATAIKNIGFDPGDVWNRVSASDHQTQLKRLWQSMLADLHEGTASIICMRTTDGPDATEHFRLILGYDAVTDEVLYHEPASKDGAYQRMARQRLISLWPLKYDTKQWLVVRFALSGKPNASLRPSSTPTAADYAQHLMLVKSRLPSDAFTVILQHPFVVIGDESPENVRARAERTVKWATDNLKAEYFGRDPDRVLDIWLFKDKASYETNALRLFGNKPSTPYGYYSPSKNALVMNIATGGGTLVHEIVHPFIEANFPDCPAWFNEGLGSLYEQSSSRNGRIIGMTNWRLAGLQRAIRAGEVPSFRQLCSTTTNEFYRQDPGTNYAQARYLCYYLQERGLLKKYYHRFVANHENDPTGYQTLKQVLAIEDMETFEKKWRDYVMTLRFR